MPGCHSGCCRPRQGTSAGTSSVGCGLQVPVYLWPTASCRLRRLGYLLAVTDAASLQVKISPGQERSRTWSENGNTGVSFTPPRQSEGNAGASMSAMMASTISLGILKQRRRSRDGTWYLPWRVGELITEKTDQMDPTPRRHGCKCLLSGCEKGKCRESEVSQNMSERTSGPLWQVNRSNAFEISENPWKHTDRAVYGYRLLQRCGFRPGSARNNKSARSPRAMSHNPGSDICLREVKAFTHRHVATMLLYSEKILGQWCFPARSSCDQQGCTPQLMQVPVEDGRHVCDLHRRHRTADGRHVPRLRPFVSDWARVATTSAMHHLSTAVQLPSMDVGAPGLRS
jgi:hypothetical protein